MTEHTSAGSASVAMTRGRHANDVHLVADTLDDARQQWVDAFSRGRADLGVEHARAAADHAVSQYADPMIAPTGDGRQLEQLVAEIYDAWRAVDDEQRHLPSLERALERARADAATTEQDNRTPRPAPGGGRHRPAKGRLGRTDRCGPRQVLASRPARSRPNYGPNGMRTARAPPKRPAS